MKKTAILIVTYNGEPWLEKCLKTILASSIPVDVFVIDNHSTDTTLQILKQFNSVQVIENQKNVGFGKANNILLKHSCNLGYENFVLLNQDVYVEKNSLENLVEVLSKNPEIGILSPMHYKNEHFQTLDGNFSDYLSKGIPAKNYTEVEFVNAAAWILNRQTVEKVGHFHPLFFHYGEDRNYCDRTIFQQLKIGITDTSRIIHDRKEQSDFFVEKYSFVKMKAILVNPNLSHFKAFVFSIINIFGMYKYYFAKISVRLKLTLLPKYIFKWMQFFLQNNFIKVRKQMQKQYLD